MSVPEGPPARTALLADRYEIEETLGHGGMADVYRCQDRVLGRTVAVKVLREVTADPAARKRFVAEARLLAGLSHPGLVTVLDAGIEGERPYLVMELVDGQTLAAASRPAGLDVVTVAQLGVRVAAALAYVHRRGIVHRDVKPANVLLSNDGRVLLADFGIAKLTEDTATLTVAGSTVGTAAYLAPEQLGGGRVGPAADVYSLALVLLEALTGRQAYQGAAIEAALARLHRPPDIPATLPPALSALLHRMVSLRPEDRPALDEVVEVLSAVTAADAATVRLAATPADPAPHDSPDGGGLPAARGGSGTALLPRPVPAAGPATGPSARPAAASRRVPLRRLPVVVAALAVVVVLLVAGLLVSTRGPAGGADPIPPNLPPQVGADLRELHEAVNG